VFTCNDPDGVPDVIRAYFEPLIERGLEPGVNSKAA